MLVAVGNGPSFGGALRIYEHHRVRSVTVAAPGIVSSADGERAARCP
jgi:hypothetical protein